MTTGLKGYLSQAEDGIWYLCDTPNVRSCCVKKNSGAVALQGDFSSYDTKKPVELINGHVVAKQGFPVYTLVSVMLAACLMTLYFLRKRKARPLL